MGMSEDPEYFNERVELMLGLAPTIRSEFWGDKVTQYAANLHAVLQWGIRRSGMFEIGGDPKDERSIEINTKGHLVCYLLPKECQIYNFNYTAMIEDKSLKAFADLSRLTHDLTKLYWDITSNGAAVSYKNLVYKA